VETVNRDPELDGLMLRVVSEQNGTAVCSFWSEDGCVLDSTERSFVCGQFKCGLYSIAEEDQAMVEYCAVYGKVVTVNICSTPDWYMECKSNCPYKDKCHVSERVFV
jgi:hypothetical protein